MGKARDEIMDRREPCRESRSNEDTQSRVNTASRSDSERNTLSRQFSEIPPTSPTGQVSRLAASTSSPSLLVGCANASSHIGANIERHRQAHNVDVMISPRTPLSPIPVSPTTPQAVSFPLSPGSPSVDSDMPPDSVFLTPAPPRRPNTVSDRPNSAPSNYLERLSGQILRLVGNHYMCSTCGRQLRTIGDQLTVETSMNHIRRVLSANHLNVNNDQN